MDTRSFSISLETMSFSFFHADSKMSDLSFGYGREEENVLRTELDKLEAAPQAAPTEGKLDELIRNDKVYSAEPFKGAETTKEMLAKHTLHKDTCSKLNSETTESSVAASRPTNQKRDKRHRDTSVKVTFWQA